ncbi:MAG: hypothetical protein PHX72_03355 [Candidatus Shapirobacteria bacterium]|nr:hypothetical protein [Candidatus Shapirobacteria bacterium]
MILYDQYLKILAEKEQDLKNNQHCSFLTVYFATNNYHKNRLKQELRSFILTGLKNEQKAPPKVGKIIIDKIEETIDGLKSPPRGLSFFAKFDPQEQVGKKKKIVTEENFIFIPLEKTPQKELLIGSRFDLDQLVWLSDKGIDGLVFQINQKEANLYVFDDRKLFLITRQENPFTQGEEKHYLEQFSPVNFRGIFHGTGDDDVIRREREENKLFLKKLQSFVKDNANLTEPFDYLVINWSTRFIRLNTNFARDLSAFFPKTSLVLIDKNITDPKQLEKLVIEKTDQEKTKTINQQLKEAQEEFDRYREEWQSILTAANQNRIQKLFIKPVIKKRGYVTLNNQIYNYPVQGSRLVNNIAPWLIHQVLTANGQIIILDQKVKNNTLEAAALLRY